MKTALLISVIIAGTSFATAFEPIDEIMHDGRQIRAAVNDLGTKLSQDYGGSSDYGEWFYTIRRAYRVEDAEHILEERLLRKIRDRFSTDIEERGWQVSIGQAPSREAKTDLLKWVLNYSAGLLPMPQVDGKLILRSFRVDGGYMVFIDLLEQRKPNKAGEGGAKETTKLNEAESKTFEESFWKEYDAKGVHAQICRAFGMAELADDDDADLAVSMSGPHFFQERKTDRTEGYLTIGAVGCFVVVFEERKVVRSEFMESLTGKGKRFKTFGECYDSVDELIKSLFTKDGPTKQETENAERDCRKTPIEPVDSLESEGAE